MKRTLVIFLVVAVLLAGCAAKALAVTDIWARPGNAGGNSAVYFVVDPGQAGDTLLKAGSDAAATVELHMSMMNSDGTMIMTPQENVPIPANTKVEFKPGGLHIMLVGLNNDLKVGDKFQVTLTFEKAGEMTLDVMVKEP